ncbi:ribonucleoside-diphosphate reductase, alpha subunit [Chlamydia ibidis]|uniref:Ribonucleoside-diphosphate reductase n=2 Tax=Chlamydia ibidis TaxID=1405396 RepID=S7KF38_9CHLA|nr:ribonucleoside-diphosphate reductase subunit alpha [Chlamydia ibidis]EPP34771.1 ribonucleoside-diphosphate reductase, alpha subunit [Chlamydia ibidis]EQM62512.1 ribonucleoside-diphosphate reductase, alpha subunit [Chlamydia ibidis 10-1398/6]
MVEVKEGHYTIVKRNGMFVPFSRDRIFQALEAAFRDTRNLENNSPLPKDLEETISAVTQKVVKEVIEKISAGQIVTVERIQDLVESQLYVNGLQDVARDYVVYRDRRKEQRENSWESISIIRRDGSLAKCNPMKISSALEKAFRATHNIEGITPGSILLEINQLTNKIVDEIFRECSSSEHKIDIELVQDIVEKQLMIVGYYEVAKNYILYREARARIRDSKEPNRGLEEKVEHDEVYEVLKGDGTTYQLDKAELVSRFNYACARFPTTTNPSILADMAFANFYSGIKESEIVLACIMAARANIEREPDYAFVAAELLTDALYRETMGVSGTSPDIVNLQKEYFKSYILNGENYRLNPRLQEYDLDKLADALDISRDKQFSYMGIQNLYDRYFNQEGGRRLETPQIFWMRVAMGLALNESENKTDWAITFYDLISRFLYIPATPTLFNSGTSHSQLSSCYVSTIRDDLAHIYKVIADNAMLSKWAGGVGNDWTSVRATGALIKGTNGKSQGVIPFIKVANDTAIAVNQGGKRKGALCVYLETWHLDYEDFLELRKNTGDDRRRAHDINTASWIPDLFFKRLQQKGVWTLFSPDDVPGLHEAYGKEFEELYEAYERKIESGEIKLYKQIQAEDLWRKMLSMVYETGHPWLTFKDSFNIRSNQAHCGVVRASNLCTEIALNSSETETAVCNLGSVNLVEHIENGKIDEAKLARTINIAIRMLDNVIDLNFYPTKEASTANLKHRAVGLGVMGFQDALYKLNISYASQEAVEFADESMEMISYHAILSSSLLAKERGTYSSYKGSKWDSGLLPIDTIRLLQEARDEGDCLMDDSSKKDWTPVREAIKNYGMRNSFVMAIAPTATISNIVGITQSIEPTYKHLFVKSNLSGEFTVPNVYLINKLKELNLWDEDMLDDLKYFDGSLLEIERIPDEIKKVFLTAFEIEPEWIIECGARRQKWIDMSQSLNLYLAKPDGKKLSNMYLTAWKKGLKSTYYLRSLAATSVEKSFTDINKRGIQPRWMKNKSASTGIVVDRAKKAPTCSLEEGCESCQ